MTCPYRIELLGGLRVRTGDASFTRFRTQRTGTLLAYLALHLDRQHPREELLETIWPEVDIEYGRMRLRTALTSLRHQLEPPSVTPGSILVADRASVRLNGAAVATDVVELEAAAAAADSAHRRAERISHLERAVSLYRGPLLPGVYDDWAVRERERLQMQHRANLIDLAEALEQAGDCRHALEYAHRAVTLDPLAEEAHCSLMRLFACTGQTAAVMRQYRELERILRREIKAEPSQATRDLYSRLVSGGEASPIPSYPRAASVESRADSDAVAGEPVTGPSNRSAARLPLYLTPFFGRDPEKARIMELLLQNGARLVTITGPGGAGKTRLAVEAAGALTEAYDGAVWCVPLAEIADAALILDTVLRVLDISPTADGGPLGTLRDVLGRRRSLLVLDNFEQLAEDGALVVSELLRNIPTLSCLITSRQRLELSGEQSVPLSPLPVPDMPGAPEWMARYASVQLFVNRAQDVRPDFQLTAENAPAVAALCERLEGIPLALELAAAWSQVLTPGRMLARLNEGTDLLTSRRRDATPRHRTLRATFEWSYQLLPQELQNVCAWLSVFRGGWTLEAADRLGSAMSPPDRPALTQDTLEQMRALQIRSLILSQEAGEEMRFRMLEPLREFTGERLGPDERNIAERAQMDYCLSIAEEGEARMGGPEQSSWMERLGRDRDNFRAVLERALSRGDAETGLRLATSLASYWQADGAADEGIRWLKSLLANGAGVSPRLRARALCEMGAMLNSRASGAAVMEALEESLRIYTEMEDPGAVATVLLRIASAIRFSTGNRAAMMPLLERSLDLSRRAGDIRGAAEALRYLGSTLRDMGDYEAAERHYQQCRPLYRQIGDLQGVAAASAEMGYMLQELRQYDRAADLLQEDLDLSRQLGNKPSTVHALWLMGRLAQDRGDYRRARTLLDEGLALARQTGDRQQMVNCLLNLGIVSGREGDHRAERRRCAEALAMVREMSSRSGLVFPLLLDGNAALECGEFAEAEERFMECLSVLRMRLSPRKVIDCLEGLARATGEQGRAAEAVRLYAAADKARCADPGLGESSVPPAHSRFLEELREALGGARFEPIWREGQALSMEDVMEEALSSP